MVPGERYCLPEERSYNLILLAQDADPVLNVYDERCGDVRFLNTATKKSNQGFTNVKARAYTSPP